MISTRVQNDRHINQVFYPAGMRQERHRHESASFSFVATGRYEESIGRQIYSRSMATLVFHPAGEKHAVAFESDVQILSIEFGDRISPEGPEGGSSHQSALIAWLGSRLVHELTRVDSASSIAIEGIIEEMLVECSRGRMLIQEKGTARWLKRAMDFVHDNFTTAISLEEIANVAGVHSAHLSRVFRLRMGCTVGEYIRRLRFEFASQQLLSTDRPLCEVACDAGFSDQSHFHRLFRTRMGLTPHHYRKVHHRL